MPRTKPSTFCEISDLRNVTKVVYLNTCTQCLQTIGDVRCRPVGRTLDDTVTLQDTEQNSLIFLCGELSKKKRRNKLMPLTESKEYSEFDRQELCERLSPFEIFPCQSIED